MEKSRKTIFIPIWGNWIICLEEWLSVQASLGWSVEKIDRRGFHFVKRKPRTRTYMFYKMQGLQSKTGYDHIARRIAIRITSTFSATNTVKTCGTVWYLASFVPDEGREKYKEILVQRNSFLIKEALYGIIGSAIFMLLSLAIFIFSFGNNLGYTVIGGICLLLAVLSLIKWIDERVRLLYQNKDLQVAD